MERKKSLSIIELRTFAIELKRAEKILTFERVEIERRGTYPTQAFALVLRNSNLKDASYSQLSLQNNHWQA
jgi:hypothetical protein